MRERLGGAAAMVLAGVGVLAIMVLLWVLFFEAKIIWQDLS